MFQLYDEYKVDNCNYKKYKTDLDDYYELIELIEHSRYNNTGYELREDADIGLKTFGGVYSYSDVMRLFNEQDPDIEALCTKFPELGIKFAACLKNGIVTLYGSVEEIISIEELLGSVSCKPEES